MQQSTLLGYPVQKGDLLKSVYDRPIVFDKLGRAWADTLPKWIRREIYLQRIAQAMRGESGKATDAEVIAHLYTASASRPIPSEFVRVYVDLVCNLMEKKGKLSSDFRKTVDADRPLTDWELHELNWLKTKLWNASMRRKK